MQRLPWLVFVVLLSVLPVLAGAESRTTSVWLGVSETAFDYEEFDDQGSSLDREEAWLPGIKAGLNFDDDRWFVETNLWWSTGTADYTSPRHDTTTDEDIKNIEILGGAWFFLSDKQKAGITIGAGYRHWCRDIHSTTTAIGLDESYRWGYGMLGLRGLQVVNSATQLVADIQVTRTIDPMVKVDFSDHFDEASLSLREDTGLRASLTLHWQFGPSTTLRLTPWYEYWAFGGSDEMNLYRNGMVVGTVHEPRSETHNAGITLGVEWIIDGS